MNEEEYLEYLTEEDIEKFHHRRALAEENAKREKQQHVADAIRYAVQGNIMSKEQLAEAIGFSNPCADIPDGANPDDSMRRVYGKFTKAKVCECGAKHTSFPDSHLHFCPLA